MSEKCLSKDGQHHKTQDVEEICVGDKSCGLQIGCGSLTSKRSDFFLLSSQAERFISSVTLSLFLSVQQAKNARLFYPTDYR